MILHLMEAGFYLSKPPRSRDSERNQAPALKKVEVKGSNKSTIGIPKMQTKNIA